MYVQKPNVRRKCKLYEKVFMHKIIELPAWERLFKRIVWEQIGKIEKKKYLILIVAKELQHPILRKAMQ